MTDFAAIWLNDAISTLSLADRVYLLSDEKRCDVVSAVKARFLTRPGHWWWEHIRPPLSTWATHDGFQHLPHLAPDPVAACWLIADIDHDPAVAEGCTATIVRDLICECPAFEYCVVGVEFDWFVIENHHDVLFAAGTAAARLARRRNEVTNR